MKKFVLKVCGITLLALAAAASVAYILLALFSPVTLADFCGGLGDNGNACAYAYRQYGITGNIEDLDAACRYALKSENDENVVKYLGELSESEGFKDYCLNNEDLGADYYDFICAKYVSALYKTDRSLSLVKAKGLTERYTKGCALRSLVFSVTEGEDGEFADALIETLSEKLLSAAEGEKALIDNDIDLLREYKEKG